MDLQKTKKINSASLLANLEIQKYHQNETRFNEVCSRDNLPNKIKDGVYVINSDWYSDIVTHWIALYALNNVTYFDSFSVEHIPKQILKFIEKFLITTNIYRIQAHDSVMHGYFCIGFFNFMLKAKSLTDFHCIKYARIRVFTDLYSPRFCPYTG